MRMLLNLLRICRPRLKKLFPAVVGLLFHTTLARRPSAAPRIRGSLQAMRPSETGSALPFLGSSLPGMETL